MRNFNSVNRRIFLRSAMACVFLALTLSLSAQEAATRRMTINKERVPLREVLNEIQSKTDYKVFYSAELVQNVVSTVNMTNATVDEILKKSLEGHALTYRLDNGTIVISAASFPSRTLMRLAGVIVDAGGNPIVGATVTVVGHPSYGVVSDVSGRFSIGVPADAVTLKVSFLGFEKQTVQINGRTEFRIILIESTQKIDDVVVTGYSTIRAKDYGGSAVTVKMEDIEMGGLSSVDEMLAGAVPGLLLTHSSGIVGSTPSIRVRGTSTLLGNKEPLWVVDGVIQRDLLPAYTGSDESFYFTNNDSELRDIVSNSISWLNPSDVVTITVLKDAAATAIYGSSAANGVIVITTKQAERGQVSVSYNGEVSMGVRPSYSLYDLMNSQEMMQFSYENYKSGMSYPSQPIMLGFAGIITQLQNKEIDMAEYQRQYNAMEAVNTDWFGIMFRNSVSHKHNVSITGGTDRMQTRAAIGVNQIFGEAKGNNQDQFTFNISSTLNFNHGIIATVSANGSMREVDGYAYGISPFNYAYNTSRVIASRDEDGNLVYHTKYGQQSKAISSRNTYAYNIENEIEHTGSKSADKVFGLKADVRVPVFANFKYQTYFAYNLGSSTIKTWATEQAYYIAQIRGYDYEEYPVNSPEYLSSQLPFGGILHTEDYQARDWTYRNDFVYDNLFSDAHRVTLQLGMEMRSSGRTGNSDTRYGYMRDRGQTFASVPNSHYTGGAIGGSKTDNSLIDDMRKARKVIDRNANYLSGYFLGVYSYKQRYVLNVSARYDASNRFGQDRNKKWEPTWSVAGKWRAVQESFADTWSWLNAFDVSVTYGYQGNTVESVSPHLIANTGSFDNYFQQYTMAIKSMPYPFLGWEKTNTLNLSLDMAVLNNRLNFTIEYYDKNSNVLTSRDVPYENGTKTSIVPGAKVKNSGYEFIVNVVPVRTQNWTWQFSVNASKTKNELRHNNRINTLDDFLRGEAIVNGKSYGTLYSFKYTGLDETDGTPLFDLGNEPDGEPYDWTKMHKLTENPLDFLVATGSAIPDFFGGFNTRLTFRQWSLQARFSIQFGGNGRLPALYDYSKNGGVPYPEVNVSTKLKDRWKAPGDQTDIPSIPGVGRRTGYIPSGTNIYNPYMLYYNSDVRVAKTDMIRCEQIAVNYDFGPEFLGRTGLKRLSLRLSATNPFFLAFDKSWDGIDPGTGNWPVRRMFVFSLSSSF